MQDLRPHANIVLMLGGTLSFVDFIVHLLTMLLGSRLNPVGSYKGT